MPGERLWMAVSVRYVDRWARMCRTAPHDMTDSLLWKKEDRKRDAVSCVSRCEQHLQASEGSRASDDREYKVYRIHSIGVRRSEQQKEISLTSSEFLGVALPIPGILCHMGLAMLIKDMERLPILLSRADWTCWTIQAKRSRSGGAGPQLNPVAMKPRNELIGLKFVSRWLIHLLHVEEARGA